MQLTLTIYDTDPVDPADPPTGPPTPLCYGYEIEATGHDFHLSRNLKFPVPPDLVLRVALNLSERVRVAAEAADDAIHAEPASTPDRGSLSPALRAEIAAAEAAAKLGEV